MPTSVMTPKFRIRRRRSSSGSGTSGTRVSPAILVTAFLLAVILITGPLILGATRLWVELPLLGVAALLVLIQGLRLAKKPAIDSRRRMDAIDLVVVLFVLYTIGRWLTSPAEYLSRIEAMAVVAYAAVFLTCRHGMVSRKYCMLLLYAITALGVAEMISGYYLSAHPEWFPFGQDSGQIQAGSRWVGTYESPNHYGSLLIMAIGAALALGSFSKLAWPARILFFYGTLMMIIGVICSGSRGSWISLVAAIAAMVVMGIRNGTMRWWWPVSGAAILLGVTAGIFFMSPVVQERLALTGAVDGGRIETGSRFVLAENALRISQDHPIFGTGPATFAFVHPHYQDRYFDFHAQNTHEDYLNCLDDYGIVGLALALFFVGAVSFKFFRPLDIDHRWQDRVLVATGFAAWVALLVHSFFDYNLHIPANALLLFALTGLALGRVKAEKSPTWSTFSLKPLGPWPGVVVILLGLAYGLEVARTAVSESAYEKSYAHSDEVPVRESISEVEDALWYDGGNGPAWIFLGDLERFQAAQQKKSEDRLAGAHEALNAYEKALQANTLDDAIHAKLGATLDFMQKPAAALSEFLETVQAQPYNFQFWYWLGQSLCGLGRRGTMRTRRGARGIIAFILRTGRNWPTELYKDFPLSFTSCLCRHHLHPWLCR